VPFETPVQRIFLPSYLRQGQLSADDLILLSPDLGPTGTIRHAWDPGFDNRTPVECPNPMRQDGMEGSSDGQIAHPANPCLVGRLRRVRDGVSSGPSETL
jgi:hypothetical protein